MKNQMIEIRKFKDEQLRAELASLQKKLFDLRASTVTEKVKDTSQFRKTRRGIARVRTELRSREMAAKK